MDGAQAVIWLGDVVPTLSPATTHQAFSTQTVMFGLQALPVLTLQAKTLLQRCHFPDPGGQMQSKMELRAWRGTCKGQGQMETH